MSTATSQLDRTVNGARVPTAGTYAIDPAHSTVEAVARHLMVSKVRGRFGEFSGTIVVGDAPEDSSVTVEIAAASIDTKTPDRDAHLRSPDFLDADTYPTLTFRSTGVRHGSGDVWHVDGDLTIKDVTRPVTLDVTYLGTLQSPFGQTVAAFSATAELNREDWDMTWNQALETGGVLVGKTLQVEIDLQAALQE